ncbi:MAG: hypothetical protein R2849_21495 [Thermomicrobiales bacterium]
MWNVVLDVLAADGVRDNLFRLRGVIPIGEGTDGEFILGAPTRLAARLLDGTYRRPVEQALPPAPSLAGQNRYRDPDQWRIDD